MTDRKTDLECCLLVVSSNKPCPFAMSVSKALPTVYDLDEALRRLLTELMKHLFWILAAGIRPADELGDIHTSVAGLTVINPGLWFFEFLSQFTLRQPR